MDPLTILGGVGAVANLVESYQSGREARALMREQRRLTGTMADTYGRYLPGLAGDLNAQARGQGLADPTGRVRQAQGQVDQSYARANANLQQAMGAAGGDNALLGRMLTALAGQRGDARAQIAYQGRRDQEGDQQRAQGMLASLLGGLPGPALVSYSGMAGTAQDQAAGQAQMVGQILSLLMQQGPPGAGGQAPSGMGMTPRTAGVPAPMPPLGPLTEAQLAGLDGRTGNAGDEWQWRSATGYTSPLSPGGATPAQVYSGPLMNPPEAPRYPQVSWRSPGGREYSSETAYPGGIRSVTPDSDQAVLDALRYFGLF